MAQQPLWEPRPHEAHIRLRDLGPWGAKHMSRSGGQSNTGPPVFSSQACLVLNFTHRRDESLSQPCPARGQNLGPVVWEWEVLPLRHSSCRYTTVILNITIKLSV